MKQLNSNIEGKKQIQNQEKKSHKNPLANFTLVWMGCLFLSLGFFSCNETWDEYYTDNGVSSDSIEIYSGTIEQYIQEQSNLTQMEALFEEYGAFDSLSATGGYTVIVCTDDIINGSAPEDEASFVLNSISDISISPEKLTDGFGISTRLEKNVWISISEGDILFDTFTLDKKVKTSNGYVYFVSGIIPVRNSVYEMFESLGDDYSYFVSLVKRYEEVYFDKENSEPISVDAMGNTVYDTVTALRNPLIDRYTEDGLKIWDMFSEDYLSTMFIPSNELLENAISTAISNIPTWLNRPATAADTLKFEKWIVKACFMGERISQDAVSPSATDDLLTVEGYQQVIDETQDAEEYEEVDPAVWRPSVQIVDYTNPVKLSNGVAYYVDEFKIPNHIVIYRVKSKFYQLYGKMNDDQKEQYFRWTNWEEIQVVQDAQSSFTLSETLPTMYYHVLTAIPSEEAIADSLQCSVTYDGLLYNSDNNKLSEAYLPAGEYYLRMGFKHSLRYSIDIYFNDDLLVEDMLLFAQGSNFHFDRGSVSDMDYYGSSAIGFPEGYDWRDWIEQNEKAVAYDTDGYQVAIVNIPEDGNFTITINSKDESYLYSTENGRTKNNVTQLMMYHWCLRPTTNNY